MRVQAASSKSNMLRALSIRLFGEVGFACSLPDPAGLVFACGPFHPWARLKKKEMSLSNPSKKHRGLSSGPLKRFVSLLLSLQITSRSPNFAKYPSSVCVCVCVFMKGILLWVSLKGNHTVDGRFSCMNQETMVSTMVSTMVQDCPSTVGKTINSFGGPSKNQGHIPSAVVFFFFGLRLDFWLGPTTCLGVP